MASSIIYEGSLGNWSIRLSRFENRWRGQLINENVRQARMLIGFSNADDVESAKQEFEERARRLINELEGKSPSGTVIWKQRVVENLPTLDFVSRVSISRIGWLLPVVAGLVGITATIVISLPSLPSSPHNKLQSEIDKLSASVRLNREHSDDFEKRITATSSNTTTLGQQINTEQVEIADLKRKLDQYESMFGDEPAKKIALPLFRKDLDRLNDEHKADIAAIHEEINRTFDLMKWLLGLLGVGNLIGGIASALSKLKAKKEADETA